MCDELCPILSQLQTSNREEEDSESQAQLTLLTGGGCHSSRQLKTTQSAAGNIVHATVKYFRHGKLST